MTGGVTAAEIAAYAAAAAAVASAGVGAYGAIQQSEAQAQAAENQARAQQYQAELNQRNEQVANNNAKAAYEQSNAREEAVRRRANAFFGEKMAGIAQSGTGFDGSNLASIEQDRVNAELDALNVRYEGDTQAKGLMVTAQNYGAQANLDTMAANQSNANAGAYRTAGYISAGSQLLSAPAKYYSAKYAATER